jgi:hypothetical protein
LQQGKDIIIWTCGRLLQQPKGTLFQAIPFDVHTPLWTSSIKFEPLRKKIKLPTQTPSQKLRNFAIPLRKNAKIKGMLMHTTPQKWLFQTPSEILVHRGGGGCTLNGMALHYRLYQKFNCVYYHILNMTEDLCTYHRLPRGVNPRADQGDCKSCETKLANPPRRGVNVTIKVPWFRSSQADNPPGQREKQETFYENIYATI